MIQIFRDFGARREVRLLPVYCSFKTEGCKEEVPWKNLQVTEYIPSLVTNESYFNNDNLYQK